MDRYRWYGCVEYMHLSQVCWWDDRKGGKPEGEISLSVSHIEPVYKTMWISSKTASEFFTASTDGTVCMYVRNKVIYITIMV